MTAATLPEVIQSEMKVEPTPIFDGTLIEMGFEMMPLPPHETHELFMARHKAQWAREKRHTESITNTGANANKKVPVKKAGRK